MTMHRREPMKRSGFSKGTGRLRAKPGATREWQDRSRKALPAKSEKRTNETDDRRELVDRMIKEHQQCGARIAFMCTGWATECNEVVRRSQWSAGYLVESNVVTLCHNCHAWITIHPDWAEHHGHQIKGSMRDLGIQAFERAKVLAHSIRLRTAGHCDVDCTTDHREEPHA